MAKQSIINDGVPPSGEPVSSINVTSLVDVMFCLLIMFMVATPLMAPTGQDVDLPAGRGHKMSEEEFLYSVISIDRQGNVFLGTLPIAADPDKMQRELAANVKIKDDGMVFIQGDQNVDYKKIVDVLVALQGADIGKVGFVIDPSLARLRGDAP